MQLSTVVKAEADAFIAVATAVWRLRQNVRATVVAKAEFFFADGTLTQIQAEDVRGDTEMAYMMPQPELVFAGLEHTAAAGEPARITLWRGAQQLLECTFDGDEQTSPGGRISPFASERAAQLHGLSQTTLQQPMVELPDAFDGAFFQTAPPSQRVADLAGGDMVVLDNLFPGHRRLMLTLPLVEVTGTGRMGDRGAPIRFRLDVVCIDAATHRCTMLWRGRIAASTVEALGAVRAVVQHRVADGGHVRGDATGSWPSARSASSVPRADETPGASPFEGTVSLSATALHEAASSTPTPFAQGQPGYARRSEPISGSPTSGADPQHAVLPFKHAAAEPGRRASSPPAAAAQPPGFVAPPPPVSAPVPAPVPAPVSAPVPTPVSAPVPVPAVPAAVDAGPADAPVTQAADAAAAHAAAEAERAREQAEAKRVEAQQVREEAQREREREETEARLEEERRQQALAEAEARARADAERFEAEKRAAEKAAAERQARDAAALKQSRQKIKTGMYGSWKFKQKK